MAVYRLDTHTPEIDSSAYIAEHAVVIGKVRLHPHSSVWDCAVLRGDNELLLIGKGSNIQESAVLHTDIGSPLSIAENVTIGHQACLHGCTVGEGSLIGIRSVVLNGARIGKNCIIGAGALVTENKEIPDGSLVLGSPGKIVRHLTEQEIAKLKATASMYVTRAELFKTRLERIA
ncbi:MAG: gamma carbonic anhydrase family protein [Limnobacter sp.]|nr:gamma carbonic anhydrase family protein [Limnobacter sp.]